MDFYKHQLDIIKIFESKLGRIYTNEKSKVEAINILWETIHQANENRIKELEKEIENLKKIEK